jgi:hypothetical protein
VQVSALQKSASGKNYFVYTLAAPGRIIGDDAIGLGAWCPLARKFHKTRCCSWDESFGNGVCVATCFNAKCCGYRFVLRRPGPCRLPASLPHDWARIENESGPDPFVFYDNPENQRYLPTDRLLKQIDTDKKISLCSGMGTGKTYGVYRWIETRLTQGESVLFIGTRIQQIAAWHSKFTDLGFKNYEEEKGCLFDVPRLLICLNSLPRLFGSPLEYPGFGTARPLPKYKALIVDEADSLARWLASPLLTESPLIFQILTLLFQSSEYVLCMDGLPTTALGEMLYQFGVYQQFRWVVFLNLKQRTVAFQPVEPKRNTW